jgi:hypothetical protein
MAILLMILWIAIAVFSVYHLAGFLVFIVGLVLFILERRRGSAYWR